MKLDILAFAAHPDDVELSCSGTLISEIAKGKKVGVIDLTRGEMGTRGTVETRFQEAQLASEIMGLSVRENLGLEDGFFVNDRTTQLKVIEMIRKYQPDVVLSNAITDRHPDHGKGADLLRDSLFLSGLRKIETVYNGVSQEAWRPAHHYHYIQDRYVEPDFIVDITEGWEKKKEAILAYNTQFSATGNNDSKEPQTHISTPHFFKFLEARSREFGHRIGVDFGEGFTVERNVGVKSILDLI